MALSVRRSEAGDEAGIFLLIGEEAHLLEKTYGPFNIGTLIATNTLSVTALCGPNDEIFGFASFGHSPAGSILNGENSAEWLTENYAVPNEIASLQSETTLWLNFQTANHTTEAAVLDEIHRSVFQSLPQLDTILFACPKGTAPASEFMSIYYGQRLEAKTPRGEEVEIYMTPRSAYSPPLEIRYAYEEDSDDLRDIFTKQSASPEEREDEHFLAHHFRAQNDINRSLVALCEGKPVGMMSLTRQVEELDALPSYFDLAPYNDLVRALPDGTVVPNVFCIKKFCLVDELHSRSIDFLQPAFDTYPDLDYCILILPHSVPQFELLNLFVQVLPTEPGSVFGHVLYLLHKSALRSGLTLRPAQPADQDALQEFITGSEARLVEGFNEVFAVCVADRSPAHEHYLAQRESYNAQVRQLMQQAQELEAQRARDQRRKKRLERRRRIALARRRRREELGEGDGLGLDDDLDGPGAAGYDDGLSSDEEENEEEEEEEEEELDLTEEPAALSARPAVQMSVDIDMLQEKRRLEQMLKYEERIKQTCRVFVVSGGSSIVGAMVISNATDLPHLRSHYDLDELLNLDEHPRSTHADLVYFFLHPVFQPALRFLLKDLFRLAGKSVLHYRAYPGRADWVPQALFSVLVSAPPRRQVATPLHVTDDPGYIDPDTQYADRHFLDQLVDEHQWGKPPEKRRPVDKNWVAAQRLQPRFSLNFITSRMVFDRKAVFNHRIFVVGASDCGIAVLEALALHPQLHMPHLTLLSPGGIPTKRSTLVPPPPHRQELLPPDSAAPHRLVLQPPPPIQREARLLTRDELHALDAELLPLPEGVGLPPIADPSAQPAASLALGDPTPSRPFAPPPYLVDSDAYTADHLAALALEARVRVLDGELVDLDRQDRAIVLSDGGALTYDLLLLTTGLQDQTLKRLELPGSDEQPLDGSDGAQTLCNEQDAARLHAYLYGPHGCPHLPPLPLSAAPLGLLGDEAPSSREDRDALGSAAWDEEEEEEEEEDAAPKEPEGDLSEDDVMDAYPEPEQVWGHDLSSMMQILKDGRRLYWKPRPVALPAPQEHPGSADAEATPAGTATEGGEGADPATSTSTSPSTASPQPAEAVSPRGVATGAGAGAGAEGGDPGTARPGTKRRRRREREDEGTDKPGPTGWASDPSQIGVVYGHSLAAYATLQSLLASGVAGSRLYHVRPPRTEDAPAAPVFEDEAVQQRVDEELKRAGVLILDGFKAQAAATRTVRIPAAWQCYDALPVQSLYAPPVSAAVAASAGEAPEGSGEAGPESGEAGPGAGALASARRDGRETERSLGAREDAGLGDEEDEDEEEEEEEELERSPEEIRAEQLHYFHNEVECEERRRIHWVEFAVPGGFPLMDICRPPPLEKAPPKPKRDEHEENAEGASNAGERADAESSAMPAMPPPVVLPDGLSGASPTASRTEAASTSPQAPQAESAPETETLLPPRIAATIRANPPPRPPGMLLSSLRKAQPAQTQPQQSAQQPSGDTAAAAAPPQEGVPAPAPAAPKPTLPSLAHQESGDDIEEWKLAHEGETIRIRCSLFICCAARDVGTFLFYALNEGSIVYDGRLVVDANYTTNDPLILSSGTLAKFSRQLVLDSQGQAPPSFDRYNGRESGTALGKYIVEHIEEVLSRTVLPDMAPPDGPPMYIPRFEAPIVESCWLPGGLAYFYARLPPPPPFLLSPTPQGRVLVSDTGAHRVRMTVDSQQRIASFSYAGTELVEFSNLKNIVGMPQTLVNRVCQRYDDEIVPDLISLLREPWATALYQDRFASFQDSLLREVQRALDPILAGMQGGEPLDAAESHFRAADFASVLDPLHRWARDQIDLAVAADQTPPTGAGATPSEPRLSSPMSGRAPRPQGGKNLLLPALPAATQASLLRKLTPAARKQVAIRVVQYLRRNQDHLPMYLVRNEAGEGLDDAALRHE